MMVTTRECSECGLKVVIYGESRVSGQCECGAFCDLYTTEKAPSEDVFEAAMLEIEKVNDGDSEAMHVAFDELMILTLQHHGFSAGVEIFERNEKWYA